MEYKEVRKQIVDYMVKQYGLTRRIASSIISYDTDYGKPTKSFPYPYNPVKDLMEQDDIKKRKYNIPNMAKHILKNDEGVWQLHLLNTKKIW